MTTAIEPLVYRNGKTMAVEPINATMEDLAYHLHRDEPVVAQLEPGDATYYNLLLVPTHIPTLCGQFGRYGVPEVSADQYLIAIKMDDQDLRGCWIPKFEPTDTHHVAPLSPNEWSQAFLAWWFRHLLAAMDE